jgi:hypothetical protein
MFCDFLVEKFKNKFGRDSENIEIFHVNVSECINIVNSQCDLFGTNVGFFCVRNVEDSHQDKLTPLFGTANNIFVLESGDYMKSKKITEHFTKSNDIYAVASFKNDITLLSLCKMILPTTPTQLHREVIKVINDTDEELGSLFRKISLLLEGENKELLKEYTTYKQSFLQDMDFIPFVRYLLRLAIKEKIYEKKQTFLDLNLSKNNSIETLIKAEIIQKFLANFSKNYIFHKL